MNSIIKKILPLALGIGVIIALYISTSSFFQQKDPSKDDKITIGIATDLTGPAAYWGESTRIGAEIAKKELGTAGYDVQLIFEDYQLDAAKALTAAQKLIGIDGADAIYAEFNPAAITIGSFLQDKNTLLVYDAAPVSPLQNNLNAYKTYLDYQKGCKALAQHFKDTGILRVGVLKGNWEPGELCLAGIKEVFSENAISESYNLGETDFKTEVLKLKKAKAEAVINVAFESETLSTLKAMQELHFSIPYGTVDDTITDNVKNAYSQKLTHIVTFGFGEIDRAFLEKISQESSTTLTSNYGAAIAYTHIMQMVKALKLCEKDLVCTKHELNIAKADNTIGFEQFIERTADFKIFIKQY